METQLSSQNGLLPSKESITPSVETTMTNYHMEDITPIAPRSSPPAMPEKSSLVRIAVEAFPDDKAAKSDSEAETIVLPGKNGYSPSKIRKTIKHEDQSEEGEICEDAESREALAELKSHTVPSSSNAYSTLGKRKRVKHGKLKDDQTFVGNSSGLSSVPTSPAVSRTKPLKNNSGHSRSSSPHTAPRKASSVDGVLAREDASSADEADSRKQNRRQRSVGGTVTEGSGLRKQETHRTTKSQPSSSEKSGKHTRSESPPPRSHHRRVSSAQTTSGALNGLSHKKKRVPAPLLATRDRAATEYHSDDSSASGSPHPRSSRLRKLATPATGESLLATAPLGKMAKNRRDGIGRTPLARACAQDDFDAAKEILEASHEDLNLADNAGNTPLQISCLEGHKDIVKLLIDHRCDLTCVNLDKDTPLLDAVENCHLDVVKLLIDAGVDPRRGNVKGEEPLDRLPPDGDNSAEIKEVLIAARLKCAETRRPSEDLSNHDNDDRSSRGTSPRPSPPMQNPDDLYIGRRRRANGRSTKTRNDLLWQPMDTKTLRAAAGKGDTETVNRILQVRDNMADTESLVHACRGGHEDVIQLLLAIGGANADPPPLSSKSSFQPEHATPMLAAIGRDKIEVVKLLLDQPNFDPTRKFQGQTYFEIAKRREGLRWREEEAILREAFIKHAGQTKDSSSRPRSPEVRRDADRSGKRSGDKINTTSPLRKPKLSSPETTQNDFESRRKTGSGSANSTKSDISKGSPTTDNQLKVSSGLKKSIKKKDDHVESNNSVEQDLTARPKMVKKRSESETAHPSSDNDPVKPRRKLMSRKELNGEKEKQRRESIASAASTASNSAPKDRIEGRGGSSVMSSQANTTNNADPDTNMDRVPERPRTLKRDDSKDRLSAIRGDSPAKRPRESPTPPRAGSHESSRNAEETGLPLKKRRLDAQGLASSSPENRANSSLLSSDGARSKAGGLVKERHPKSSSSHGHGPSSDGHSEGKRTAVQNKRPTPTTSNSHDNIRQVEKASNIGATPHGQRDSTGSKDMLKPKEQKSEQKAEQKSAEEREAKIKRERAEQEERKRQEDRNRQETERIEEERKRAEAEKLEAERRRLEADKLEAERKRLEAEKAEAERKRLEAEKAEAEERARREEEKRLEEERLEQQRADEERKAAEKRARELEEQQLRELEARAKHAEKIRQEEADRKEKQDAEAREEKKRIFLEQEHKRKVEEIERKRAAYAAREAEARAERKRVEAERRAKLPRLLQAFETWPNPQSSEFATLFKDMIGVRHDTMVPDASGPEAKELWILNTQVGFLLGEKDLQLSRYTAWERIPATNAAKLMIYNLEGDRYACTEPALRNIYPREPGDPSRLDIRNSTMPLFMDLNLFFVKLSEFLYIVPHFAHLRNIKMSVKYTELLKEDGSPWLKWKQEPGAGPFCPRWTYYMNGQLVGEDGTRYALPSSTPIPRGLPNAPRDPDNMIGKLSPESPRYMNACRSQGLWHLLPEEERDAAISRRGGNGRSSNGNGNAMTMNGFTPSPSAPSEAGRLTGLEESCAESPRPVNGLNGDENHARH